MILLKQDMSYDKRKVLRPDGSFYNLVEVKINRVKDLEFHQINTEQRQVKLADIAHLRMLKAKERGFERPVVIVWDGFPHQIRTEDYFEINYKQKETVYLSLNSYITYHLRYLIKNRNYLIKDGKLEVKHIETTKDQIASDIIRFLEKEKRLKVFMSDPSISIETIYQELEAEKDCIAVGEIGFPSRYSRENGCSLVFNTSYFLLEEEDYISNFSLLGEPYNLRINKGRIETPPLYNRYALLLKSDGQWEMKKLSLKDLSIECLGKRWDLSQFAHNDESDYSVYTRYFGVEEKGRTAVYTPEREGNIDFVIIGREIVGMKYHGGIEIPQNGFVLSIPINEISAWNDNDFFVVDYRFLDGSDYREGIQCGPGLVKDGEIILNKESLQVEEFFRKRFRDKELIDYGVVPTDYASDIDQTRAARMVLCIDMEGGLGLLAAESVNKGLEVPGEDSTGATLLEMAVMAKEREYRYALNLDGGGSTNIQYLNGQLIRTADRRGLYGIVYERMVPNVGVIK